MCSSTLCVLAPSERRLRSAALYGLGVVAEHGGKLLSRSAAADLAQKLVGVLEGTQTSIARHPKLKTT